MRNRHSRNALLYGLGGFLAIQCALIALIAWGLPWLRDPQHGLKESGLNHRLASAPTDATTVVMLGSSRTAYGLNAEVAAKALTERLGHPVVVYNFGLLGAGPCATLLSLKRLLDDGIRPDLLLIEVVPFRLGEQGLPADLDERYLPTAALRREELSLVQHYAGTQRKLSARDWWLGWCVPCYHHRFALVSHTVPTLLHYLDRANSFQSIDRSGWLAMPVGPGDLSTVRRSIEPHFADFRTDGPSVAALEEMLRLTKAAGIRTALVVMPEGPAFRSWYPPQVQKQVEELLVRFGRQVPVIDARGWIGENGFRDSHHLLLAGATSFSERLARTLSAQPLKGIKAAGRRAAASGG